MPNLNVLFVIWRELFEAVLIVTIVHAFLARHLEGGKSRRVVGAGIAIGVVLSLALGAAFQVAQSALSGAALDHFQTAMLLLCAALMTQMCLWMKKHARHLKRELEDSLGQALTAPSAWAVIALVALAIAREGFEVVVYLYGMGLASAEGGLTGVVTGALVGAVLAALTSWALARGLRIVNPKIFFKVTGAFLLITASSMLLTVVARLMQADLLPTLADPVWDSSWLLDDRLPIGQVVASITGYQATPALLSVLVYACYWALYFGLSRSGRSAVKVAVPAAALLLVALWTPPARAQSAPQAVTSADKLKLKFSGYGDMQADYYDYGANRNLSRGARKDARAGFDATRFVAKLEGFYLPYNVEFEAEVEFEHGGTGAEMELEYEESGEYETEVSHGGEVFLEEFYLKKYLSSDFVLSAGRIKVGLGLLSLYSLPTDYLAVHRSEAETTLLPESWNEMGVEAALELGDFRLLAQIVNGLDSSSFSSQYWVSSGHQQRFEETSASDLAGVLRSDYTGIPGTVIGVSGYYGGTTRNRPQPDLVKACDKTSDNEVAPCGYVDAPVFIGDVHAKVDLERLHGNAVAIWGTLKNAGEVTARNSRLSNDLHVLRTAVADEAFGAWAELGYDIGPTLGITDAARLEPFARYDFYDTMFKSKSGQVDNPRYTRRLVTVGVSYSLDDALFVKFDASRRSFGSDILRKEDTVAAGLGFIY